MAAPDLAGFRDAAIRMRAEMGTDVPFFTPIDGSYPPGTPLDPETGQPFDPTVAAVGSGWSSASLRVGVYTQTPPRDRTDDEIANAVGWFAEGNVIFDADPAEYAEVDDATEAEWDDGRYEIAEVKGSSIDNVTHRKLIYARRK